jgi:sensor histidine kinase regulating citrate/malate metabolism
MNKRGMELSMNFIIIAALALVVLIVGAIFFMGGFKEITDSAKETTALSTQERSLAEATCKTACAFNSKSQWESPDFTENVKSQFADCDALMVSSTNGGLDLAYSWDTNTGDCTSP